MKTVNHYEHNKSYYLLLISCCWPLSLLADDFFIVSSTHSGAIQCSKPILRSCIPSLCPAHVQKTEKAIKQALKMGGLSVSSSAKLASKFQCITSESSASFKIEEELLQLKQDAILRARLQILKSAIHNLAQDDVSPVQQ